MASGPHIGVEVAKISRIISDFTCLVDCAKIKAFNLVLVPLAECGYPVLSGLLFKDLKHEIPEKLRCGR